MKNERRNPSPSSLLPDAALDSLRAAATSEAVARRALGLKLRADGPGRFKARCPLPGHGDQSGKTPPLAIHAGSGGWKCYGCDGAGGDGISLYQAARGVDFRQAVEDLADVFGISPGFALSPPAGRVEREAAASPTARPDIVAWAPSLLPPRDLSHPSLGEPASSWEIRDGEGRLFGVHARFETADGKEVRWWRAGAWSLGGVPVQSAPLYGSEDLRTWDQGERVWIAEGERAADALRSIGFQALGTVTGASSTPARAMLAPVATWRGGLVLWADNDPQGRKHMDRLAGELRALGSRDVRVFAPEGLPPGGDAVEWLADRGLTVDLEHGTRQTTVGDIAAGLRRDLEDLAATLAPHHSMGARAGEHDPHQRRQELAEELADLREDLMAGDSLEEIVQRGRAALSRTGQMTQPAEGTTGRARLARCRADVAKRYEFRQRTGRFVCGVSTGLPSLDRLMNGLQAHRFAVISGPPGKGKTSLALTIAARVAREVPVLFWTFENAGDGLLLKLLAAESGCPVLDFERGSGSPSAIDAATVKLDPILDRLDIREGTSALTVEEIRAAVEQATEAREDFLPRAVVELDFLQLWAKGARAYRHLSTPREKVDAALADLCELRRDLGVFVLALSSTSRAAGGYGTGGGRATMDNPKESGEVEYSADLLASLISPEDADTTPNIHRPREAALSLVITKNRYGPVGEVPLVFDLVAGTLSERATTGETVRR